MLNNNYRRTVPTLVARGNAVAIAVGCIVSFEAFSNDELFALEEVVVTATRRAESLQDVPLAVSAITGESMAKAGIFETTDMNRSAPNLQVSSPYGAQQPNFSVRGVGVGTEFNANAASPVGVYVDQVYQTFRASHGQQLYDLEQVEVVRGPQGTLYGRNTTGGAINFITKKPNLEGTSGYVAMGYGNYDRQNVEGAFEFTPIADKLGVRLAGTYVDTDSYVENKLQSGINTTVAGGASGLNRNSGRDPGGWENWGVRGSIRFLPTEKADLLLKVYAAESKGSTEVPIPVGSTKGSDVIDYTNPNFPLSAFFQGIEAAAPGLLPQSYSQSANGLDVREVETDTVGSALIKAEGIVFTADIALNDELSLIAVTGYDSGEYAQDPTTDCDATSLSLCAIGYNSEFDAFNVDVRLDYSNGPLKLIVGAFYGEDSIENDNLPNFFNFTRDVNAALGLPTTYFNPGGAFSGAGLSATSTPTGVNATQEYDQDRESFAIYGEANYDLTDTVTLTVGLRYSEDDLEYSNGLTTYYDDAGNARMITVSDYQIGGEFAPYFLADVLDEAGNVVIPAAVASPGDTPNSLTLKGSSDDVSGRIIVDWKPTEEWMLYASYSRGYRAGTINGLAYGSANQVYFVPPEEVDAFELGFKSRLLDDRLQLNGALFYYDYVGQQGQVVDSTATSNLISLDGEITGLELDAQFAASESLTFTAALGWLDSEYADGECDPSATLAGLFPAQDGSCVLSQGGAVSVEGNPFPYAAEFTFNFGFDWDVAELGEGTVLLHADAAYTDQFYYDAFEDYSRGVLQNVTTGDFAEGEDGYWTFNARLSYDTENYTIALWAKNLTDEEYYPYGISTENLFANGYRVIGPPRTYGAELKYHF